MQDPHANPHVREEPPPPPPVGISPIATALTLAVVVFAVVLGMTAPRLRDRHGTVQQDLPIGDLATIAAMHEARAAADALGGRARESALAQLPQLATETVARTGAADLSRAGWIPDDARNVELAPNVHGTMVIYRHEDSDATLSVTMLPDDGRAVRYDGFGRAVPLAPGDEWLEAVTDDSGARPHVAYAFADGKVLWLVLADRRTTLVPVAKLLR
jgi:hypothetical protein